MLPARPRPRPRPSVSAWELERLTTPSPLSWLFWPFWPRGDNQTGSSLLENLALPPQVFFLAVTQVPREGLSCTWAPLALEPASLGAEGAAGTVSPIPIRTRTPCQVEGGGEGRRTLAALPEHTGSLQTGGRLPPRTSQLWLLIGGLPCRPSHSSPAGQ